MQLQFKLSFDITYSFAFIFVCRIGSHACSGRGGTFSYHIAFFLREALSSLAISTLWSEPEIRTS